MDDFDAIDQLDSFNLDVGVVDDADEHGVHDVGSSDFMRVAAALGDESPAPIGSSSAGAAETDVSGQVQAAVPSSSYKPYPIGTRLLMSQPEDSSWLTPYLCLLRSQLEVFSATPEEIAAKLSTGGNKVPPIPGQVGIRCVHCKNLDYKQRAKSSESFPSCIKNVHQAVRNYQRHHYPKCQAIPAEIRAEVEAIKSAKKAQKSRGSAGNYWMASCVRDLHMVDGKGGRAGIFFAGTEDSGEVPDVSHILGGESSGGLPVAVTCNAAAGADNASEGVPKSNAGNKKKKSPKIKKVIKSMFRKDNGAAPTESAMGSATNASVHSSASGTASSLVAGTLNHNDIPQQQPPLLSNDSFRNSSNSTVGNNVPIPSIVQQVHSSAAMQMYSPNWELTTNGGTSAVMPPPPSSSAMPVNRLNPLVMTGTDSAVAMASPIADGFQVGPTGNDAEGGRTSSFPAGGSEFPIEMFEPRPLREDGRGFVDEVANDPAASAYFAASSQNPAQGPRNATMPAASGNAGDAWTNHHFQTEYGFMGINDVVKGHEEAEKRRASSYRDRRSSWTSRDSHGSSTFLSSGSKRGLSSGDSVGTNEYEPPRRRPSLQSSIGGELDDFGGLDLDNDDDFNDDFGMGVGVGVGKGGDPSNASAAAGGGAAVSKEDVQQQQLLQQLVQNDAVFSEMAAAAAGGGGGGGEGAADGMISGTPDCITTTDAAGDAATGGSTTRAARSDSDLSGGSLSKEVLADT